MADTDTFEAELAGERFEMVGAVPSAVELLVSERPENDAASLPTASCTAAFEVAEFVAGAV